MSKFAAADVRVPTRYAEWAFEYKLGYHDGHRKQRWAWRPKLGNTFYHERYEAYMAGRAAGRKQQVSENERARASV